ncbi:FAD-dependent monooxygenase [Rhizobium pusense]|uniref:FAD-dependent monooxygenase n=1 Tax=Agrobacterium pusense TaxID=648995 RepID=UPI001FCE0CA1|nr:FAD-dependent monooxygenase [Agrobacterium pusense]MCJ2877404.1 FAD-dependent monooxygenase [Agrobacterium pusense]
MTLKVVVAGAGIGGLAAAAAMHRQGLDVTVIEQTRALAEVGAGLQVSPNAAKVLRGLGLEEGLKQAACTPEAFCGYDWDSGQELYRTPLAGSHDRLYGAGYYQVHRADLHALLASAVPSERLRLATKIVEAGQEADHAWVKLADGDVIKADVVIGADGIRSAVRKAVGPAPEPKYTGMTAFRGLIPASKVPASVERVAANWQGPRGHVIHYYLRGFEMLNIVAIMEVDSWTEESWSLPVEKQEMLALFEGWHPTLLHLLSHIEQPFRWGLYGRAPTELWGNGRISLLGDAVHPMVPFLAQGAAMAMEDGYVLGGLLGKYRDTPVEALRKYEAERRPRANRVQQNSLERAATIHEADPLKRAERNRIYAEMSKANPEQTMHKGEWIYSYDVDAVIATV